MRREPCKEGCVMEVYYARCAERMLKKLWWGTAVVWCWPRLVLAVFAITSSYTGAALLIGQFSPPRAYLISRRIRIQTPKFSLFP